MEGHGLSRAIEEVEGVEKLWKTAEWAGLRAKLDEDAKIIITENREKAGSGRAALSARTKEWVLLSDEDKLQSMKGEKGLIKAYQDYITEISRQLKYGETAFLDIYKIVATLPDPRPALAMVLRERSAPSKISSLENTVKEQKATIASHEAELRELTNQEVTIQYLKETLTHYKEQTEADLQNALETRTAEFTQEKNALVSEIRRREDSLTAQVAYINEEKNKQTQLSKCVQDEMLLIQGSIAEAMNGQEMKEKLLIEENEALSLKAAELAAENKRFATQLSESCTKIDYNILQDEVLAADERRKLIEESLEEVEAMLQEQKQAKEAAEKRNTSLQSTQNTMSSTIDDLRAQLQEKNNNMWSIEAVTPRKTEENGKDRAEIESLTRAAAEKDRENEELTEKLREQRELISSLETDLEGAVSTSREQEGGFEIGKLLEEKTSSINMLAAQRDRFKKRLHQLEEENINLRKAPRPAPAPIAVCAADPYSVSVDIGKTPKSGRGGPDRLLTSTTRFFLAHRLPRIAFFSYFLFLHAMVFMLFYKLTRHTHAALRYPHSFHGAAHF
eukprot:TRINITY_DN8719_c1_g1_i2.p1 TRINITY_DN8719_c1_g1~~TRINITY_DN8719_c1_g1_i2.p1  ORF type:complete len:562 (+),score=163.72 TRINITY_DN8719_c1_g1_i2:76-1761(+)